MKAVLSSMYSRAVEKVVFWCSEDVHCLKVKTLSSLTSQFNVAGSLTHINNYPASSRWHDCLTMLQCTETVLTFSHYVATMIIFSMIAHLLLLPLHQNLHQEAMPHQHLHQIHVFPASITYNMITISYLFRKNNQKS